MEYKPVVSARTESITKPEQVAPVDRMMAELDGTYYRLSEVSDLVGVSVKTLRRLIRKGHTTAPSKILTHGGMQMYLYTPKDVEEIKEYYRKKPDEI